jgi:hypothetical protein
MTNPITLITIQKLKQHPRATANSSPEAKKQPHTWYQTNITKAIKSIDNPI